MRIPREHETEPDGGLAPGVIERAAMLWLVFVLACGLVLCCSGHRADAAEAAEMPDFPAGTYLLAILTPVAGENATAQQLIARCLAMGGRGGAGPAVPVLQPVTLTVNGEPVEATAVLCRVPKAPAAGTSAPERPSA